jgi:hypothetical protein
MKTTIGDLCEIDCPYCGYTIRDLWDANPNLVDGDKVDCQGCEREVEVLSVEHVITVTLKTKE